MSLPRKTPSYQPLEALSFSRYENLRVCMRKGSRIKTRSNAKSHLLGKWQLLGEIFHEVMEVINGDISEAPQSAAEFRACFNGKLDNADAKIRSSEVSRHLGCPGSWPESAHLYLGLRTLFYMQQKAREVETSQIFAETVLYSRDKLLFGKLDAYIVDSDGIDLIDYKTGVLSEDEIPREAYVHQLYLYAYLIEENHGIYPRKLSLVGKDGKTIEVEPSRQESLSLAAEMRSKLQEYNSQIAIQPQEELIAQPSEGNCLYCRQKIMCREFWGSLASMKLEDPNHAAIGIQSAPLTRSRAGVTRIELDVEASSLQTTSLAVNKVFEGRFPDLEDDMGQRLLVTGLRRLKLEDDSIVAATNHTVIARMDPL